MGHDHSHGVEVAGNERRLTLALGMTALFMAVEIVGGIVTGSLALLSDAAHMFTDVMALGISLVAVRIGKRPVDDQRSYGYQRLEILAAALNALMLFGVAIYILYEAWVRLKAPPTVDSGGMLWIAAVGLVVNVISMKLLAGGKDESLNVKGAYLEVWSDMLGSAGVIVAALVIRFTGWTWVDSLVAVGIGLWVLPRTWKLLKASTHILMEGTPTEVDVGKLRAHIESRPGVTAVHDFHVWTLTSGRYVMTAHVVVDDTASPTLVQELSGEITSGYGIFHTTIQLEHEKFGEMHEPLHDNHPKGETHDH